MISEDKSYIGKIPIKPELNSFDLSMDDEDLSHTVNTNITSNLS